MSEIVYGKHALVKITGIQGAVMELLLFFVCATLGRYYFHNQMFLLTYYWLAFTVLTGIWELTYITRKKEVAHMAHSLIVNNTHVWDNEYDLRMILPHNLAKVFYAEYAAYADRLYGSLEKPWYYWSIMIEGTHCFCCGLFAILAFVMYDQVYPEVSTQFLVQSMAFQFMNSILYMSNYKIQMNDPTSKNYVSPKFPLKGRVFMLINVFWMLMPTIVLLNEFFTHI